MTKNEEDIISAYLSHEKQAEENFASMTILERQLRADLCAGSDLLSGEYMAALKNHLRRIQQTVSACL